MTALSAAASTAAPPVPAQVRVRVLQVVFVLSGFCGLIYESIWSHYLKLFVGHAAYAQTVVLVVFIGGMALGAWGAGRYAERIRHPLWAYAAVELVVGLISLVFHTMFVGVTDWAYVSLLPAACRPESPCLVQWVVAAAMIAPQSVLLGMTFPFMTTGILRIARDRPGSRIALFYFLNSIGAVAGVLASGFLLIPALGLPGTLLTAGLANIAIALVAYAVGKGADTAVTEPGRVQAGSADQRAFLVTLLAISALTGLSSFVYEIIWIRMLVLVVGASTQAFELMLAAFILGLALGGLWVRKHVDRFRDLIGALAIVQVLMGVAALATLPVYDSTFDFLAWLIGALRRSDGGYLMYNLASHGIAMAVMLPATFLAGMTLPLITTALLRTPLGERAVGYVYAANTLGAILGVIIAVHFALPVLGLKHGLMLGAAVDIALGAALLLLGRTAMPRGAVAAWCGVGIAGLIGTQLFASVPVERAAAGVFRHGLARVEPGVEFLFHRDGKTATVTVTQQQQQRVSIRTNGKPDAAATLDKTAAPVGDEYTMVLTGLLPLAWHPQAKTAAVVGFGSGISTATMLGSPNLTRVDTIEIEPQMVEGAKHFGDLVAAAYADPRSNIVIDDAKSYFARSRHKYDIIVSEPSNPWVSGVSSLFTVEWYRQVHRQLADDGLLIQWLQIYEFSDDLAWTILRALDGVFADYAIYAANDGDLIIVAAKRPFGARPPADFAAWPGLKPALARLDFDSVEEIESRRLASRAAIRPLLAQGTGVNSDYFPIVDHEAPKARFLAGAAMVLPRLAASGVPVVELIEGRDPSTLPPDLDTTRAPNSQRLRFSSAQAILAFMATGTSPKGTALPSDVALLRAALWDCAALPASFDVPAALAQIAAMVNPYVRPQEARRMWAAMRGAKCAGRLTASERRWLDLAAAVAERALPSMVALGSELARDKDTTTPLRFYALSAAAGGLVAQGRPREAQALLDEVRAKLPDNGRGDAAILALSAVAADRQKGR